MPRQMTEEERQDFLAGPHVAVLSVSRDARSPHATPVWYAYEPGGNVTFFTGPRVGSPGRRFSPARPAR